MSLSCSMIPSKMITHYDLFLRILWLPQMVTVSHSVPFGVDLDSSEISGQAFCRASYSFVLMDPFLTVRWEVQVCGRKPGYWVSFLSHFVSQVHSQSLSLNVLPSKTSRGMYFWQKKAHTLGNCEVPRQEDARKNPRWDRLLWGYLE